MTRLKTIGLAVFAVAIYCSAERAQANTDTTTIVKAEAACARLGLNTSEAPFAECVASLRDATALDTGEAGGGNQQERSACKAMGLAADTSQFSRCVTDLEQTLERESLVGQG